MQHLQKEPVTKNLTESRIVKKPYAALLLMSNINPIRIPSVTFRVTTACSTEGVKLVQLLLPSNCSRSFRGMASSCFGGMTCRSSVGTLNIERSA